MRYGFVNRREAELDREQLENIFGERFAYHAFSKLLDTISARDYS